MFLADDLAQLVPFEGGEAGQAHGHLGDLLLIDGDAVGFVQHLRSSGCRCCQASPRIRAMNSQDEAVGRRDG